MKTLLIFLLLITSSLWAKESINVYTYHNHAPFIIDKNEGLTYNLIDELNSKSTEFTFKLKVVPRSRLNYILKPWINKKCEVKKCKDNWIVLWVNHKWGFGKDSLENFFWKPLLNDSNAIISSKDLSFEYNGPSSLIGKTLAGIAGHKYVGIDDLVKQGKINRVNGVSEANNLKVVLAKRADVTLLPKSAFDYYVKINSKLKALYISQKAHQEYKRNIMTNRKNSKLNKFLKDLDLEINK